MPRLLLCRSGPQRRSRESRFPSFQLTDGSLALAENPVECHIGREVVINVQRRRTGPYRGLLSTTDN